MESITIKGMSCQHCVTSVKNVLEKLSGISAVEVHLDKGLATFINDGVRRTSIVEAIHSVGFETEE
jgi:copper chaperone